MIRNLNSDDDQIDLRGIDQGPRILEHMVQFERVGGVPSARRCASPRKSNISVNFIADGYDCEVLSTTLVGSGGQWTAETDAAHAYLYNRAMARPC
ncbi:hypothetical protein LH464_23955 [Neorhizobium sp. T786]|nr:hypothetical protein [Neorhizobium xiangyangii]MCB5205502.1 hypothetical protein [Neorhizobium xiangyangii]